MHEVCIMQVQFYAHDMYIHTRKCATRTRFGKTHGPTFWQVAQPCPANVILEGVPVWGQILLPTDARCTWYVPVVLFTARFSLIPR